MYCVLHALRRYHCNAVGSAGVPVLSFVLRFIRFEAMSLQHSRFRGSVRIELLYRVSQALRRYQCITVAVHKRGSRENKLIGIVGVVEIIGEIGMMG